MTSTNTSAGIDDIGAKMLAAMVCSDTPPAPSLQSLDEQKRYLKQYIDAATVPDRQQLCGIVVLGGHAAALKECAEGVIVNLDGLPETIVGQMYTLLSYKLDRN